MDAEDFASDRIGRAAPRLAASEAPGPPRLDGVRKAACLGPGVVASTFIVTGIFLLVPTWFQVVAGLTGIAITVVLVVGVAEPLAVRALWGAQRFDALESDQLAAVVADLCGRGLGPPATSLFVSRRDGPRAALGVGRCSVVLHRSFTEDFTSGRIEVDEAVALVAHAGLTTTSGRTRHDLAIRFWSTPWRVVSSIGMPQRALLGFAWKARPVVFGVAIWQSFAGSATTSAAGRPSTGVALALILASTYVMPRLPGRWEHHVNTAADHDLVRLGLGPALASVLRRCPQTARTLQRIQVLEQPPDPASLLDLESAGRQPRPSVRS